MKKSVISLFIIVGILAICFIFITREHDTLKYNNKDRKSDLITTVYSIEDIKELVTNIESQSVSYSEFKKHFNVQCMRKTHQGYYVVLFQDDGSSVFVFFDNQMVISNILSYKVFLTTEDFKTFENNRTTLSQIIEFDDSWISSPLSLITQTAHIIQEGIVIITYTNLEDGSLVEDGIIDKIEFVDNQTLEANSGELYHSYVPYILEIDKTS